MKQLLSGWLLPVAVFGAALMPTSAAWGFSFNIAGGPLTDGTFTDFNVDVSGVAPADIANVNLLITALGGSTDYLNQVEMYLNYNGQILLLAQGLTGDQMINTLFDDAAADPIDLGSAPYTGSFQPQGTGFGTILTPTITTLAGFNGLDPNGTWTLRVYDLVLDEDVGALESATLDIAPVPVPPQVFGTLLVGAIGAAKQWRKQRTKTS